MPIQIRAQGRRSVVAAEEWMYDLSDGRWKIGRRPRLAKKEIFHGIKEKC